MFFFQKILIKKEQQGVADDEEDITEVEAPAFQKILIKKEQQENPVTSVTILAQKIEFAFKKS